MPMKGEISRENLTPVAREVVENLYADWRAGRPSLGGRRPPRYACEVTALGNSDVKSVIAWFETYESSQIDKVSEYDDEETGKKYVMVWPKRGAAL